MSTISADRFDAVLFDLDGVLTATASLHSACWKQMFDEYLRERRGRSEEGDHAEFTDRDYALYVDGKPRYAGVQSFLESRGIELTFGTPEDPSDLETVCGLGNRKSDLVQAELARGNVEAFAGSVKLVRHLRQCGIRTAVVSSSTSAEKVLRATGMRDLFEVIVDGLVARQRQLNGKPAPDTFLAAAAELGVPPDRAVVVEDALSGVEAGSRGGFGLVVGVDRQGQGAALRQHGAHVVVTDLAELL
jgi:beta-phosphoglucomutase family hydrolase